MKLNSIVIALSMAGSIALFAGCAKDKACCDTGDKAAVGANVSTVNTKCPIGGDDFDNKAHPVALTRAYKGETIGFCCESCVKSFDKKADADKAAVLAAAKANKTL